MKNIIRKNICKFLQKYLTNKMLKYQPKTYFFVRWLISLIEDDYSANDVIKYISLWMFNNGRANNPFTDIFLIGDIIYIVTDSPCIWNGKDIDGLTEYIRKMVRSEYTVNLLETNISSRVTAVKYMMNTAMKINE